MRAITVEPGTANSIKLEEIAPPKADGALLVRALALGVCGTDRDIIDGHYGWAPPGARRLVLGHESLGEVEQAPQGGDFKKGDIVVGIVRRPDPVPCPACASGEWDMCRNGQYTERGIKEINGYGAERWTLEPDFAVKADPSLGILAVLTEPASVIAKAWDHIERIGERTKYWKPRTLLVTGAGPVGLLAAMMGAQRGLEVHVFDRNTKGPKPELVRDLGGKYHTGDFGNLKPDVVIECTGAAQVVRDAVTCTAADGITCLAGIGAPGKKTPVDISSLNRAMVLENDVVFGSVNANRAHYRAAADALAKADKTWLARLITRRVPLSHWQEAFERRDNDIKVIVDFTAAD
ncbi:MAG TPA: glucose 1-dehydrogenase [Pseudolabrys sp.]|nr:glucose 1-dehydrogenase [Pseudolabrys sp.]